jgi:hypothetical protein
LLTAGVAGLLTQPLIFQLAAPEGFSALLAVPAHTAPGSLAAAEALTRFHHRFFKLLKLSHKKPPKSNKRDY